MKKFKSIPLYSVHTHTKKRKIFSKTPFESKIKRRRKVKTPNSHDYADTWVRRIRRSLRLKRERIRLNVER
jgi:hypothetical protein